MSKRATIRKRCAECRTWFRPPARLVKQQVVCGASCRLRRRRKQARARRAVEPARYREEERERKRRWRARQRRAGPEAKPVGAQPGPGQGVGHALGEMPKHGRSQQQFADLWDTLLEVSRAGWEREVRKIVRQIWQKLRQEAAAPSRVSRTG